MVDTGSKGVYHILPVYNECTLTEAVPKLGLCCFGRGLGFGKKINLVLKSGAAARI